MIGRFLRNPKAYRSDPKGYAVNQLGHLALGAGLLWFGVPFAVVALGFGVWEIVQVNRFGAEAWDSLEDLAFVVAGAFLDPVAAIVAGLFLVSGIVRR